MQKQTHLLTASKEEDLTESEETLVERIEGEEESWGEEEDREKDGRSGGRGGGAPAHNTREWEDTMWSRHIIPLMEPPRTATLFTGEMT